MKGLRCSSSPGIVLQSLNSAYFYSGKSPEAPLGSDSLSPCSQSSGLEREREGVAVLSGGKSWRIEDWWVPGDGQPGTWEQVSGQWWEL